MNAELMVRFKEFPEESKRKITVALSNQCKKNDIGYKEAIRGLPQNELQWLVDYETELLESK